MDTIYRNCQSCGMPLKRDPEGGGTHADGTRSTMYCSLCYRDGAFVEPDLSAAQMQDVVRGKLRSMGVPRLLTGLFTRGIPRLARWNRPAGG